MQLHGPWDKISQISSRQKSLRSLMNIVVLINRLLYGKGNSILTNMGKFI